jgi:hypothetical protein
MHYYKKVDFFKYFCMSQYIIKKLSITMYSPISSAGLLTLWLMKYSKASFRLLVKRSLRWKQWFTIVSILSLKSSNSCTIVLSFSGSMTIVRPFFCKNNALASRGFRDLWNPSWNYKLDHNKIYTFTHYYECLPFFFLTPRLF